MAVPTRISTLVFLLLLVLSGVSVHAESSSGNTNESCLTRDGTAQIIEKYTLYLTKYPGNRTMLEKLVDENVTAASDSLSYVFQKPLNTTLAHNLQEMLEQEAAVPAVPSVNTIFTSNTCDTITWYWEFTTKPYPTRGIVILFVNLQSRKIYKTYREANIGAILANQGSPECQIPDSNWKLAIGKEGLQREESSCEEVVHQYRDEYKPSPRAVEAKQGYCGRSPAVQKKPLRECSGCSGLYARGPQPVSTPYARSSLGNHPL